MDSVLSFKTSRPDKTTMPTLPFDVLNRVFELTLDTVWWHSPFYPYLRSIFRLAHVDRHWRTVCLNSAALWSTMSLGRKTSVDLLTWCMARTVNASLHFLLTFNPATGPPLNLILGSLARYVRRMETLYISFGHPDLVDEIAVFFNAATLPALRSLKLDGHPQKMKKLDSTLFVLAVDSSLLCALRLRRVWFSLSGASSFTYLRVLVMRDILHRYSPTQLDWINIQSTATALERLALHNVGCREITVSWPDLVFPALTHLDLLFTSGSIGLIPLVGAIRTPGLHYLSFSGESGALLNLCLPMWAPAPTIRHLVIDLTSYDILGLRSIFDQTPNLCSLDLRAGDQDILQVVGGQENADGLPMCRTLAVLFLSDAAAGDVRQFLEHRQRVGRLAMLSHLLFHNPLGSSVHYDVNLGWLREKATVVLNVGMQELSWLNTDFYVGLADYTTF
ncbi:hypothetical protein B0H16DRAFT_1882604, partial [Mycena metata]